MNDGGKKTSRAENSTGQKADKILFYYSEGRLHTTRLGEEIFEALWQNKLVTRLIQVLDLMEQLRKVPETERADLDNSQRALLSEFFPTERGKLDEVKIKILLSDKGSLLAWNQQVIHLLQTPDIHPELTDLKGHEALERSQAWLNQQEGESEVWQSIANKAAAEQGSEVRFYMAPQGLYLNQDRLNSRALGFAWLFMHEKRPEKSQQLLKALDIHIKINEQLPFGPLAAPDQQQLNAFRSFFIRLKQEGGKAAADLRQVQDIGKEGHYLLQAGERTVAVSINRQTHRFAIYNPDAGELIFSGERAWQDFEALLTAWKEKLPATVTVEYYQVDLTQTIKKLPALNELPALLSNVKSEQQRMYNAPEITLHGSKIRPLELALMGATVEGQPLTSDHLRERYLAEKLQFEPQPLLDFFRHATDSQVKRALCFLNKHYQKVQENRDTLFLWSQSVSQALKKTTETLLRQIKNTTAEQMNGRWIGGFRKRVPTVETFHKVSGHTGNALQAYGYISAVRCLAHYRAALRVPELTDKEKDALHFHYRLAQTSLGSNIAADLVQFGLGKTVNFHGKVVQGLATPSSRLSKMMAKVGGSKLARFGGAVMGGLTSGFNFYDAWENFSQATQETDSKKQQDLIVNGNFSLAGGVTGLGMAGAGMAAAAGSAGATIAGPVAVVLSIGLLAGQQIYAAVRAVEEIETYRPLNHYERLRTGWLNFFGLDEDPHITNDATQGQQQVSARQEVNAQLDNKMRAFIREGDIDRVIYSKGSELIDLERKPLKRITSVRFDIEKSFRTFILEDRIHPEKAEERYQYHKKREEGIGRSVELQESPYHYRTAIGLEGINDRVNLANPENDSPQIVRINTPVHASLNYSSLKKAPEHNYLVNLGEGNDDAVGDESSKNIFIIEAGRKNYSGGALADKFVLQTSAAPAKQSKFDGREGEDWFILSLPDAQTGYNINLDERTLRYHITEALLAELHNIEHVMGSMTEDKITGNNAANILHGGGGNDRLVGLEGDDTLLLANGRAVGGAGNDCYHLLQNSAASSANVLIEEEDGGALILLDYSADAMLPQLKFSGNYVTLTFKNTNGSDTQLILQNCYRLLEQGVRQLQKTFTFVMQDGTVFQLPELLKKTSEVYEFHRQQPLQVSYLPDADRLKKAVKAPSRLVQALHNSLIRWTGKKGERVHELILPDFMRLLPQATAYSDNITGDNENNTLSGSAGDFLRGNGGADDYIILPNKEGEVAIDNLDNQEIAERDTLHLRTGIAQVALLVQGADLILYYPGHFHPTVRLKNFLAGESYRHLQIQDEHGKYYQFGMMENKLFLYEGSLESPEHYVRYAQISIPVTGLVDDNRFFDESDVSVYSLSGGEGDDAFHYYRGDGHSSIADNEGSNSLVVHQIDINQLNFFKRGNNLEIVTLDQGKITWKNFYNHSATFSTLTTLTTVQGVHKQRWNILTSADENADENKRAPYILLGDDSDNVLYRENGDNSKGYFYGFGGNDIIHGEEGNNYLSGGRGNDSLFGASGDDTYLFSPGDGVDIIDDTAGYNILCFNDINRHGLYFEQADADLVIIFRDNNGDLTDDKIIVKYYFSESQKARILLLTEGIELDDDTIRRIMRFGDFDDLDINAGDNWIQGTHGRDNAVFGGIDNNKLTERGGNNLIFRGKGNDDLDIGTGTGTGTGSSHFYGGEGSDRYIFRPGCRHVTITDSQGNNDRLVLNDIQKEQLHFSQEGSSLNITFDNQKDKLTMQNQFTENKQQAIERIELDNGSYLLLAEALVAFSTVIARADNLPVSLQQHLDKLWLGIDK